MKNIIIVMLVVLGISLASCNNSAITGLDTAAESDAATTEEEASSNDESSMNGDNTSGEDPLQEEKSGPSGFFSTEITVEQTTVQDNSPKIDYDVVTTTEGFYTIVFNENSYEVSSSIKVTGTSSKADAEFLYKIGDELISDGSFAKTTAGDLVVVVDTVTGSDGKNYVIYTYTGGYVETTLETGFFTQSELVNTVETIIVNPDSTESLERRVTTTLYNLEDDMIAIDGSSDFILYLDDVETDFGTLDSAIAGSYYRL